MACDIFRCDNVRKLLKKRGVLLVGDSNIRCMYKDLVHLIHSNDIPTPHVFRSGGVNKPYMGDKVIKISERNCGRDYYEIREYKNADILVKYIFVTRAYSEDIIEELRNIREGFKQPPKIVLMNSFLWDLTRWGPLKEDQYKEDMVKLFKDMKRSFPSDTLIIWLSTLPVATERVKGGVFIQQVEFVKHSMRFWILEGNKFVQQLCVYYGYNLLDLHYHMRHELHRRATDGIHWDPAAVRYMTNIILTHIALNLDEPLPGNFSSKTLNRVKEQCNNADVPTESLLGKDVLDMIAKLKPDEKATENDVRDVVKKTERVYKKGRRRNAQKRNNTAEDSYVQERQREGRGYLNSNSEALIPQMNQVPPQLGFTNPNYSSSSSVFSRLNQGGIRRGDDSQNNIFQFNGHSVPGNFQNYNTCHSFENENYNPRQCFENQNYYPCQPFTYPNYNTYQFGNQNYNPLQSFRNQNYIAYRYCGNRGYYRVYGQYENN